MPSHFMLIASGDSFYGGAEHGYTDYKSMREAA
jgi:hypothetical protein